MNVNVDVLLAGADGDGNGLVLAAWPTCQPSHKTALLEWESPIHLQEYGFFTVAVPGEFESSLDSIDRSPYGIRSTVVKLLVLKYSI